MKLLNWLGVGKTNKAENHLRKAGEIIDREVHRSEHGTILTTAMDFGAIAAIEAELQAAVQCEPTNPEYQYLLACIGNYHRREKALHEIQRIYSAHPSFADAAGYVANSDAWYTPLSYPAWNQSQIRVPESIIPAASRGCYLNMVRDGCRRVVSFFSRLPQRSLGPRFNASCRTAVRFHFMQTPYGPIVGAYVLIDTHPTEPYTSETWLKLTRSIAGCPDQACSGYWLVRLLAQQNHTFIVLAEPSGGPVYFNKRLEFDNKAVKELRDVTNNMSHLDPVMSDGEFDLAKSYCRQHFSLDAITF